MKDRVAFALVRSYIRIAGLVKDRFHRDLPGLGWSARRLKRERVLNVQGRKLVFDPAVGGAYGRLLAGQWNEPETHLFLNRMADSVTGATFLDVGASVGAMVLDLAGHPNVRSVIAFEPHAPSADVCRRSARLNGWSHVEVRAVALGATSGTGRLAVEPASPLGGRLVPTLTGQGGPGGQDVVDVSTVDREASSVEAPCLLLIDVEGRELDVLNGARSVLERARPLVIFEYNALTREHFELRQVRELLGPAYDIWRLKVDGTLDRRYQDAWNCVAVPLAGPFHAAASGLVDHGAHKGA